MHQNFFLKKATFLKVYIKILFNIFKLKILIIKLYNQEKQNFLKD